MSVSYQLRAADWVNEAFGSEIAGHKPERVHRFLEEALELAQSLGCTEAEARQLAAYVWGREKGEPAQEVGGTVLTLAILCESHGIGMEAEAERELARVRTPEVLERVRQKNKTKPRESPLPGTVSDATNPGKP